MPPKSGSKVRGEESDEENRRDHKEIDIESNETVTQENLVSLDRMVECKTDSESEDEKSLDKNLSCESEDLSADNVPLCTVMSPKSTLRGDVVRVDLIREVEKGKAAQT